MPERFAVGSNLGLPSRGRKKRSNRTAFAASAAAPRPPSIEMLEDRLMMSRTWVVATTGNDAGAGTLGSPFRSIQRAANVANTGDTVLVRGGVYHETVHPLHNGVTFQNYGGESVTVSGADRVSGFSGYSGPIYKASMPWSLGAGNDQVFVDGHMINEARFPNTSLDVSHPALAHIQRYAGGTIYDSSLNQPAGFWNGATIHVTPGQGWVAYTGTVTSSGPGWIHVALPALGRSEQPVAGNAYYLTGTFRALDAAGEWYRANTGLLYVRTPSSDNPNNHDIEAKHRLYAFDLSGHSGTTIRGINIFAATVKTDWSSTNTTLDHINAQYLSQYTYSGNGWSVPSTSGIMLCGSGSILENSTIAYSAGDGVYVGRANVRVTNNIIHDIDYSATDAAPVRIIAGGNIMVDHNTIYNAGRSGVTHRVSGVRILYNTIHDVMLQNTDGGATYTVRTNGAGSEIAYNTIYNIHAGGYGGAGIFLDNDSSHYSVHDNTTFNVDIALKLNYTSFYESIYNNRLGATLYSLERSGYGFNWAGSVFSNNVFYRPIQLGTGAALRANVTTAGSPIPSVPAGANLPPGPVYNPPPITPTTNPTPAPPPAPAPAPTPTPAPVPNNNGIIQAENFSATKGAARVTNGVGQLDNGDWVEYKGLNFRTGVSRFQAAVAVLGAYANQKIELRIDGPNGQLIGVLTPRATAGWFSYNVQTINVARVTGVHDLYLVGVGRYAIGNIDYFKFL